MQKLIILDRDGVINHDSDDYIKSPAEWVPIPGSLEAISRLTNEGFHIAVATNQSAVARKLLDMNTLIEIHNKMHQMVEDMGGRIDAIFFCPHGPRDDCSCRKPKPGLLLDIADRFGTTLTNVPSIGDSLRDLQASISVGASPMLVKTGKGNMTSRLLKENDLFHTPVFEDLEHAVDHVLTALNTE
ncbi:MAG: D-glycero-beta-D-manno-heptose 1,7-bisphosphate 7-phosphatase [Gammaproteobacteria bacterium]|nr:MAG: D-glycero-beta-D-manno-heptose 1,7-bisphosphate 7-phosphatase [Gammaproteobacteria bacterium]